MKYERTHPVARALRNGDLPTVAEFLRDDCGIDFADEYLATKICRDFAAWEHKRGKCKYRDTIVGLVTWARNRVRFPVVFCGPAPDIHLTVPLHVFFPFISETPEMLLRLGRGEPRASPEPAEARSKMFTGTAIPVPIDATAARVAPPKPRE